MGSGGIAPFILQPGQFQAAFALPLGNKPQYRLNWKLDWAPEPARILSESGVGPSACPDFVRIWSGSQCLPGFCQNLEWVPVPARILSESGVSPTACPDFVGIWSGSQCLPGCWRRKKFIAHTENRTTIHLPPVPRA
jgi:hypothetical protein